MRHPFLIRTNPSDPWLILWGSYAAISIGNVSVWTELSNQVSVARFETGKWVRTPSVWGRAALRWSNRWFVERNPLWRSGLELGFRGLWKRLHRQVVPDLKHSIKLNRFRIPFRVSPGIQMKTTRF